MDDNTIARVRLIIENTIGAKKPEVYRVTLGTLEVWAHRPQAQLTPLQGHY